MPSTFDITDELADLFFSEHREEDHPAVETIVAYHNRQLAPEAAETIRKHLAACPDCTNLVLEWAELVEIAPSLVFPVFPAAWIETEVLASAPDLSVVADTASRIGRFVEAAEKTLGLAPSLALAVLKIWDPSAVEKENTALASPAALTSLEAKITQLYSDLHVLVARVPQDASVRPEIDRKRQQLRALQIEEADQARRRAEARLPFDPAEGSQALARAAKLLEP